MGPRPLGLAVLVEHLCHPLVHRRRPFVPLSRSLMCVNRVSAGLLGVPLRRYRLLHRRPARLTLRELLLALPQLLDALGDLLPAASNPHRQLVRALTTVSAGGARHLIHANILTRPGRTAAQSSTADLGRGVEPQLPNCTACS